MKRRTLVHLALLALAVSPAAAQQTITGLPQPSPHATMSQTVGISTISVDYHRPAVGGREVWGGLVPYDQIWRAGANDNTTITLSDDARVEGQLLAAGTYGLHMVPGREKFVVAFSRNTTSWGSFTYDAAEDALRVEVKPEASEFDERLRYSADEVTATTAVVALHWEKLRVPFRVEFDTNALVLAKVERDLRHLPQFFWQGWNSAANWTANSGYALEKGLEWADRSITMNENGANLTTKMRILVALGRSAEVAPVEQRILAIGNEAEVNQLGYTHLLNLKNTTRAVEIFRENAKDHPQSWNCWDSLGEGLAAAGDKKGAIENYTKALAMAPENQKERIEGVIAELRKSTA
jgi:tetratricopeptide (TPR) repeat protein